MFRDHYSLQLLYKGRYNNYEKTIDFACFSTIFTWLGDSSSEEKENKIDYEAAVKELLSQDGVGFDKAFYEQPNSSYRDILMLDYDRGIMVTMTSHVKKSKSKGNKRISEFCNVYSILGDFTG